MCHSSSWMFFHNFDWIPENEVIWFFRKCIFDKRYESIFGVISAKIRYKLIQLSPQKMYDGGA